MAVRRALVAVCILQMAVSGCAARSAPPPAPATTVAALAPASPVSIAPLEELRRDLLRITQSPGVRRGLWGIAVHSLDRDERLFELNPQALFVPASATKLVSAATAADAVGWDYRYETRLGTNGTIVDGTLRGDLFVVGAGDPSIGNRGADDLASWVEALKTAGIRAVDGRVIGDDDALEEPRPALSWAWDDLGYGYGAIFGALNYAENRMAVTVTPASAAGQPPTLSQDPAAGGRAIANRVVTGERGSAAFVWPEQRPNDSFLTIAGSVPVGGAPSTLNVAVGNPTIVFASALRKRLKTSGIDVSGDAWDLDDLQPKPAAPTVTLYVHRSPTLAEIVRPMMKESINLYAEAMMRLNSAPGVFPTNDAALDGLRARFTTWGIPLDGQQIVDGSGVSRRNVLAPETLLSVLRRHHDPTNASPWMQSLPVAGVDGSLANRMKGTAAENNVRAKTGTMSNIRSLAGYATTRDGERLVFVAFVNNFEGPGAAANQALDALAVRLATLSR